jgi:hypothetical protein
MRHSTSIIHSKAESDLDINDGNGLFLSFRPLKLYQKCAINWKGQILIKIKSKAMSTEAIPHF